MSLSSAHLSHFFFKSAFLDFIKSCQIYFHQILKSRPWFQNWKSIGKRKFTNPQSPLVWFTGEKSQVEIVLPCRKRQITEPHMVLCALWMNWKGKHCSSVPGRTRLYLALPGSTLLYLPWSVSDWFGKPIFEIGQHNYCQMCLQPTKMLLDQ